MAMKPGHLPLATKSDAFAAAAAAFDGFFAFAFEAICCCDIAAAVIV